MINFKKTEDPLSPYPHVNSAKFRLAIQKYFYADIEPEYTEFIKNAIINGSVEALDTLKELAEAINNDPNFAETIGAALSGKLDTLVSGSNIKTVNGTSILGEGDLTINTYADIPGDWDITHSISSFITSINDDEEAVPGKAYCGLILLTDLPQDMGAATVIVEVLDLSAVNNKKLIRVEISSDVVAPYNWEYISTYGAAGTWRSWVIDPNYIHTDNNFTTSLKTKLENIQSNAEVNVLSDWNLTDTYADDYIKNKPTIPDISGKLDIIDATHMLSADLVDDTSTTHLFVSSTEKSTWDGKLNKLRVFIGSLYRNNVNGGGGISINGTSGLFPTVRSAGTYTVSVYMLSNTLNYSITINFGTNSYTLTAVDGEINDTRLLTVAAGASWSAAVVGSVAAGTILDVKIYSDALVVELGPVAISSNYNDLSNRPTIPAALILSDWNLTNTNSKDYIKNKPTIPIVPTDVSSFNNDAGYLTSHLDISGKADIVANGISGNIVILDANGNIADSGHAPSEYLTSHLSLTNYVTLDGTQNITGEKTFVGNKKIKFKLSATTDKLGFTGYSTTNAESGNFEILPNDRAVNLGIYSPDTKPSKDWLVGFKYQAKDSTGTVHKFGLRVPPRFGTSTYTEYYFPVVINGQQADNTGSVTIPIPTNLSSFTDDVGYLTLHQDISGKANTADLATVATSGSYNDLLDKPSIVKSLNNMSGDLTTSSSKLIKTSVPNVTSIGSASTWNFALGTGNDAHTLIISGGNSTAPTLGTAIDVATGNASSQGTGASILQGISVSMAGGGSN